MPPPDRPPKEMQREPAFIEIVFDIRDTIDTLETSTRAGRLMAPPTNRLRVGGAGLGDYLKEAFLFRWNLLFLGGGGAAAAMTPLAPVLLPARGGR